MKRCCRNCALWDLEYATGGRPRARVAFTMAQCQWTPPIVPALWDLPDSVPPIDLKPRMMAGSYGQACKAFVQRKKPHADEGKP